MSKLMMEFHIILVLIFFTDQYYILASREVEASPLNRCYEMMRFNKDVDSFMKLGNKEILNLFCKNATRYFKCISDVLKEHTGFTVKEMAYVMEGTDPGEYLNSLVKMEESVEEMCRNRTQYNQETSLEMDVPCFERGRLIPVNHCVRQSLLGYLRFTDLQPARELSEADGECIVRAYQLGCVAATLREECGVETYNNYKTVNKDFFNRGTCSSDVKQTLKTTLLGFDMTESRKNVYRAILDLMKRRK